MGKFELEYIFIEGETQLVFFSQDLHNYVVSYIFFLLFDFL